MARLSSIVDRSVEEPEDFDYSEFFEQTGIEPEDEVDIDSAIIAYDLMNKSFYTQLNRVTEKKNIDNKAAFIIVGVLGLLIGANLVRKNGS
jgi:hypothetical protein